MKMLAIGTQFSTDFRSQQWRAVELMEGLMNECIRMEKKFEAGLDLTEQCKQMKKEAMAASLKRRPLPPAAFPKDHCWVTLEEKLNLRC